MLFLSFSCEDIGVAMVTNMISQLQESFPLRHAAYSFAVIEFFSSSLECWLFWTENINIIVLILLYNFISKFHNIFVTGILR